MKEPPVVAWSRQQVQYGLATDDPPRLHGSKRAARLSTAQSPGRQSHCGGDPKITTRSRSHQQTHRHHRRRLQLEGQRLKPKLGGE